MEGDDGGGKGELVISDATAQVGKLSKRQKKNLKKKLAKTIGSEEGKLPSKFRRTDVGLDQNSIRRGACTGRASRSSLSTADFDQASSNHDNAAGVFFPSVERPCSMISMPRWSELVAADAAVRLVLALSLRNETDAFVYLERAVLDIGESDCDQDQAYTSTVFGAALVHCADRGFWPCVQLLLCCEAPVDGGGARMLCGGSLKGARRTPLELASGRGHVEICQLLLDAGAGLGRSREAAESLGQYGMLFSKERSELLSLFDRY